MADREKVIKGLECCSNTTEWKHLADPNCEECPYAAGKDTCTTIIPLMRDALELLKAQEPRVMSLDEVKQYIGYSEKIRPKKSAKPPLWTESRNGTGIFSGYRNVENLQILIDTSGLDETYIAYKHWRCWTARPTDEQREAVPWTE